MSAPAALHFKFFEVVHFRGWFLISTCLDQLWCFHKVSKLRAPFFLEPIFQLSQTVMTGICTVYHRSFFPFIFCLFIYFFLLRLLGNYFEVETKVPCLGVFYTPSLLLIHRKFKDQKCLTA